MDIDRESVDKIIKLAEETYNRASGFKPLSWDDLEREREAYRKLAMDRLEHFMDSLALEELYDLVALSWIGRGDFRRDDWRLAVRSARQRVHPEGVVGYLTDKRFLAEYLRKGLKAVRRIQQA